MKLFSFLIDNIEYLIYCLLLYVGFRLVIRGVEKYVFQLIVDAMIEDIMEENEKKDKPNKPNTNDFRSRDHKKEKVVNVERMNDIEENKAQRVTKKIVNVKMPKILGFFTGKFVKETYAKLQQLDPKELVDLGPHQAQILASRRAQAGRQHQRE